MNPPEPEAGLLRTDLLAAGDVDSAARILRSGGLVAIPTETVYGLAADATNAAAVARVFAAKGRPQDNPLIVHVDGWDRAAPLADQPPAWALKCIEVFWPGPLSVVFAAREPSPLASAVRAGLSTVAIRCPDHATFRKIIVAADRPLAAPSANRSGRPSGTDWRAVAEDLSGRVDAIVCEKPSRWGVESTVIDATGPRPVLLRPGAVSILEIEQACGVRFDSSPQLAHRSPGTRHRHYQPAARVRWIDDDSLQLLRDGVYRRRCVGMVLAGGRAEEQLAGLGLVDGWLQLRRFGALQDYAAELFQRFRQADRDGAEAVYCERPAGDSGLVAALIDRISRAADA